MTQNMRAKTEKELDKLYEVLEKFEPESNEYHMITDRIKTLTELINDDDKRVDAIEASEKKHLLDKKSVGNAFKLGLMGLGVTAFSWVGTWLANDHAQKEAHNFESDYAYTSKARLWNNKEPNKR